MTGDFKVSERLQWGELTIGMLIFFVPIGGLIVIGNLFPDKMTAPIAIAVIFAAIALTLLFILLRRRARLLVIDGQKWKLIHNKTGRTLMEFDLSLTHTLAIAIRQGVTGKYSLHVNRWLQVFLEQNGRRLDLESPYLESFPTEGVTTQEMVSNMRPLTDPLLMDASQKPYTYDEVRYLMEKPAVGSAMHGLPAFILGATPDLFEAIMQSADRTADRNMFLSRVKNMHDNETAFADFIKELNSFQAN